MNLRCTHWENNYFQEIKKLFIDAYEDATSCQYGYLVIDCDPSSQRELKLRTNIFPGEKTICYLKK